MPACCITCIATRPSDWPASAEAQIQEGDTGDSWAVSSQVSSFVDPKTGRYALPENGGVPVTVGKNDDFQRTRHGRVNEYPGWNTLEVIVRGDRATHIVNGVVNMRVSDIKSWDAGTQQLGQARPRQDRAAGRERRDLLSQHQGPSAHARPTTCRPSPKLTEVWFPVPREGDAGRDARAPRRRMPSCCSTARASMRGRARTRGAAAGWKIDNGEMVVGPGTGDIQTKAVFGDVQLHVEWRDPQLPPDKVNQDRGNSGIFLQDVYEVQVLDNFENPTYVNGMVGSIYKQYPPLVNATLPAETWNTYDIIFTAPRFAADGSLTSPARLTVLLNGVLVQNNSVLKGGTTYIGAPSYRPHGDMPLRLQDHGHLVRFRNIWLRKL